MTGISGLIRELLEDRIRGRLFFDELYGEYYFFVPDEPVYMGCFDDYLAILYIHYNDAKEIFSENELMEVALEGFSIVSLSEKVIYELSF
ncbi:hypothetical protein [Methanothermobacter marburgensis]|uniref:hypothetical protein n=1 Tax=Methanothermobacter marburgensis TaxID=145263 RepID=UPI0035B92518